MVRSTPKSATAIFKSPPIGLGLTETPLPFTNAYTDIAEATAPRIAVVIFQPPVTVLVSRATKLRRGAAPLTAIFAVSLFFSGGGRDDRVCGFCSFLRLLVREPTVVDLRPVWRPDEAGVVLGRCRAIPSQPSYSRRKQKCCGPRLFIQSLSMDGIVLTA